MFLAALMSRSCRVPQGGHCQLSSASRYPHAEQVVELGYHRSITTSCRRYRSHLYSSWRRNSPRAAIRDRACEAPVLHHARHVQVLDHDHVVLADQPGADAVQEIPPGVADLAVRAGHLRRGLDPVRGAFPAAGHTPLVAGQVAGLACQVSRIGDLLTVRCHGEVGHAEINTDGMPGLLQGLRGVAVDGEGHVPAPVAIPETITIAGSSAVRSTSGQDHTNRSGPSV